MKFPFSWNELADQPHNVAPRAERTRHHLRRWRTYLSLAAANLRRGPAAFVRYRRLKRAAYASPLAFGPDSLGIAVSPIPGREDEIVSLLRETGARQTLLRLPSWERDRLPALEAFGRRLADEGFGLVAALLQRRDDVLDPAAWSGFCDEAFARFSPFCRDFEIGHAWNRTKWGVWDHTEYLALARAAADLRGRYGIRLVGPAVIDFEFHLYPPTLGAVPFDVASSLLYVDRVGAPENGQWGWTAEKKAILFKAYADVSAGRPMPCWITEMNWPLEGTGPYSPASGKPNVGEEVQADYLARYDLICLTGGQIERVYWWQLVAPGYGLVDSRETPWRRRPSFAAFRTLAAALAGSTFLRRERSRDGAVWICHFEKDGRPFAAAWSAAGPRRHDFGRPARRVVGRDGADLDPGLAGRLDGSPRYVYF